MTLPATYDLLGQLFVRLGRTGERLGCGECIDEWVRRLSKLEHYFSFSNESLGIISLFSLKVKRERERE